MNKAITHLKGLMGKIMIVALLTGISASTLAHTALEASNPADGSVVNKAPEQFQLRYTEAVALVRFSITDSKDKQLKLDFTPSTEPTNEYVVAVPAVPTGSYKVDWAAVGADGHTVSGSFAFVVDPAAPTSHAGHGDHGGTGHAEHQGAGAAHGAAGDAGHDH